MVASSLEILLTIPVSVTFEEPSFSKLKLIKNYLRTSMTQEHCSNLSIIAIENAIADSLNIHEAIDE